MPGISVASIKAIQDSMSTGTLYNIIAGGYNSRWSIFSMGIGPYINASIIMQLLRVAIPKLEQLSKEGEDGRKKITSYTRYLTVVLSLIQATGITLSYRDMFSNASALTLIISVITLVAGSTFIMWLAEQITNKGITNGSSMIIFMNIVSNLPSGIRSLVYYAQTGDATGLVKIAIVLVLLLAVIVFIVIIHDGERRIPVQYSAKMVGRRTYGFGGQTTFMPIKVNTAGVIAIIFAVYLLFNKERLLNQVERVFEAYIKVGNKLWFRHVAETANRSFSRFIVGQCTEAVILGLLCIIGMKIFRFPYAVMTGTVVGVTALIPIIGAFLGAIIGAFMIFTVDPMQALLFLIFLIILMQIEGNLIYPRVVGNSIGLPGMWVLAAVTIGGGLWGVTGMLFGVPAAATIYKLMRESVNGRLATVAEPEPDTDKTEERRKGEDGGKV